MNRSRRTLLAALVGLAALALVAVLLLPRLLDGERYRRLLEERVSSAIGREVHLGEVRLSLLPTLSLRVDGLEVAGLEQEGGEPLLVADGLRVGVRLRPLLQRRLEIASATVTRPRLRLIRDTAGEWNVAQLLKQRSEVGGERDEMRTDEENDGGASGAPAAARQSSRLAIHRLAFADAEVSTLDHSVEPTVELVLSDLDLELEGLTAGESFDVELDTRFGEASESRVRWSGAAGPLGEAGEPFALQGEATLTELGAGELSRLAGLAGLDLSNVTRRLDRVSGKIDIDAAFPQRAALRGNLDLGRVEVALPGAGGERERAVAIDVATRFDLTTENGADVLRVAQLEIDVDEATLELTGTVEVDAPQVRRVDLELSPARLPADRLAAFLAVALPDLPFSFSSSQPIEVEGRIHGIARPGQPPEVEGRLVVADLRLLHSAMTLPIEHLSAEVAFAGDRVTVAGLKAVMGESDLQGELEIEGFARPRVRFDLASRRANLDQLFGALEHQDASPPTAAGARDDLLDRVEGEGRLRVEQASWGDLEAQDLVATVRLADGAVTLDPLTAGLYDGRFSGRVEAWPGRSPLPFDVSGTAEQVSVDRFLAGALDLEDRLEGRFSGTVRARGAAGEWEQVARSLEGQGEMRIENGEVKSFPLLRTVAQLSGVFGEEGLAEIANRLATNATRFSTLRGVFRIGGGSMTFDHLTLESSDYTLRGDGAVDLVSTALRGDVAMTFSAALSELMRAEDSRAAELFASSDDGRIRLPLALRGALSDPEALVDWPAAAQSYAERRLGKEVERQVGKLLDRLLRGDATPTPSPATP